jgi:flagellar biosynthesis protein FlhG
VQRFRVLVTQAREAGEGEALYRNFATATRRFLGLVPEFMGEVPADATLPRAARLRQPVVDAFPTSEAAAAFRRLAEAMDAWPQPRDDNDRLDRFMRRLLVKSRLTAQATRP